MRDKVECEIFVAMNEEGDWVVVSEESEALERLANEVGGYQARIAKIIVKMSPPVMAEATVKVADEAGETQKIEANAA
jgi:hypothetical protein